MGAHCLSAFLALPAADSGFLQARKEMLRWLGSLAEKGLSETGVQMGRPNCWRASWMTTVGKPATHHEGSLPGPLGGRKHLAAGRRRTAHRLFLTG